MENSIKEKDKEIELMDKIQKINKKDNNIFINTKEKRMNHKKVFREINIKENKLILKKENLLNKSLIKSSKNKFNIKIFNFLFLFKLFLFIISISYSESNLRTLSENEIILIVKETSINQPILSQYIKLPDEVIINGKKEGKISTNYNNLNDPENTIILRWNSPLDSCKDMFYNLDTAISIDFSNFDSSQVTDMTAMFHGCKNLKSVNFNNLDTRLLKTMEKMFYQCNSLISVNFSSFDTSLVTSMAYTFEGCSSLVSLELSNFKTDKLQGMDGMFRNAESLISLDLSNFNISLINSFTNTFDGCKSLIFLNLKSFEENGYVGVNNMFSSDAKYLIYCFDKDKNPRISKVLQNIQNQNQYRQDGGQFKIDGNLEKSQDQNNNCSNICFSKKPKIIIQKKMCIDDCANDDTYIYEYNNICYNFDIQSTQNDNIFQTNEIFEENQITNSEIITNNQYDSENKEEKSEGEERTENTVKLENETQMVDNTEKVEITEKTDVFESTYYTENNGSTQKEEISEVVGNTEMIENTVKIDTTENEERTEKEENSEKIENTENTDFTEKIDSTEKAEITEKVDRTEKEDVTEKEENTQKTENSEKTDSTEKIENIQITENSEEVNSIKKEENTENTNKVEKTDITGDIETNENSENSNSTAKNQIENYEKTENNKILENFSVEEFFKESIDLDIANEDSAIKDEIIKNIKYNLMKGNLDTLLVNVTSGEKKDLIAIDKNTIYQITTSDNQKNNEYANISTVNLGKCEDRLKDIYGINKNLSLLIFKIDYFDPGLKIPVIGYEIYHPTNKSQLDLKYCEDILVKLNIPVSIDESVAFKHDPSNEYYNDECSSFTTENGTDILIEDRRNEFIDNNLSLCEASCTYKGYNEDTKKALCECESKTTIGSISDIMNNENILSKNFSTNNTSSNTISLKCTQTLFTKDGLLTNIGNYILLFTFIFFIISVIIFYKCGYHIIETAIKEIISKKEKNNKKSGKKINIFKFDKKIKKSNKKKSKIKAKKKKNPIISNPKKKNFKKIDKTTKKEKPSKEHNFYSSTKLELKNTNIIINIGKNKNKNTTFIESNIIKKEKPLLLMEYKNCELNSFEFQKALINDKRTFCQYYYSLLKFNNILLFSFFSVNDYNIKIIKISLFFLSFDIHFFINSLFFDNSSIHKIYEDKGSYNISYFIPKIIISFFISYYIIVIIKYFTLSQRNLLELKNEEDWKEIDDKAVKTKKCLNIKYILFYVLSFIFLTLFWYYLSSFCAVYRNSQFHVITNTFISFGISLLYPFIFNILPCIFRTASLKNKNECFYNISQFFQLL